MIHILLLILKIIGILILVILALVLLALLIFILDPLVYETDCSWDNSVKSIKARFKFRWLFRLIAAETSYEDETFRWRLRIAWKKFGSDIHAAPEDEKSSRSKSSPKTNPGGQKKEKRKTEPAGSPTPEKTGKKTDQSDPDIKRLPDNKSGKSGNKKKSITDRINDFFRSAAKKMRMMKRRIRGQLKILIRRKNKITMFLSSEVHKNAFHRTISEGKKLFARICPKHSLIHIEYGFTDPSYTGYVTALASLVYPSFAACAELYPDFENRVFRGNLSFRGKIKILYGLIMLWNLLMDRNVRKTFLYLKKEMGR